MVRSVSKVWWIFELRFSAAYLALCWQRPEAPRFRLLLLDQSDSESTPRSRFKPNSEALKSTAPRQRKSVNSQGPVAKKQPQAAPKRHSPMRGDGAPFLRGCAACGRPLSLPPVCAPWPSNFCRIVPCRVRRSASYARAHAKDDAGALAWLVLGYAQVLDKDYAKAIDPLSRAKIHAGDLGDYVGYYLGISYLQTGHTAEALATLADFGKTIPIPCSSATPI